mmetsp:Transcript_22538/g.39951  ORF Transcript_22538/g.39951 Transcript_22538/m.39951 type:complete len:189 (-) Transcript_22538:17-583(-)
MTARDAVIKVEPAVVEAPQGSGRRRSKRTRDALAPIATDLKASRTDRASPEEVDSTRAKQAKKEWNNMSHLCIKRFKDDDPTLTAGAKRDRALRPYVAVAEMDPSGRAKCKSCGEKLQRGNLRLGLMMECHKGYRNLCTLHPECFWKHPETQKLDVVDEIFVRKGVSEEIRDGIKKNFNLLHTKKEET